MSEGDRSGVQRLSAQPASAAEARRFVAARLREGGLADLVDAATLLVSEVVTNAVLHAGTELVLRVDTGDARVRVEVADGSPLEPAPRHYGDEALTGRGLELVDALASSWGVEPGDEGKTVWFELADGTEVAADPAWVPSRASRRDGEPAVHAVRLENTPVRLLWATVQHGDALLREAALIALAGEGRRGTEWHAPAIDLGVVLEHVERALAEGVEATDLVVGFLPERSEGALKRLALIDEAERMAQEGLLLGRPSLPEIGACRRWYLGEIARQLAGQPPTRWESPVVEVAGAVAELPPDQRRAVEALTEPAVVADDTNRIVFVNPAAAKLLGWTVDDLTGRRLTSIVPPELREAHLCGYTRYQVTGESGVIGNRIEVPALRKDGSVVPVALEISVLGGAPAWFLALLRPAR